VHQVLRTALRVSCYAYTQYLSLPALPEGLELVQAVDHAGTVLLAWHLVDSAVAFVEGVVHYLVLFNSLALY